MWRPERIRDLACLGLLALVVAAFFWPLIATEAWIPHGGGDLVSFLWPMYDYAARSLRSGIVPLWNPHLRSGAPFLADNQSGVFYPPNLLTFALSGPPSYAVMQALVVFHVWLAAAGTFVLLRGLKLRRVAALTGALGFALSDLFVTHLGNLNLNATAAWLPLVLWLTHQALTRRQAGWAAAAGVTLAVAALAGHAQMLLFLGLAVALYVIYHLGQLLCTETGRLAQSGARTVGLAALIAAVSIGAAALTLLPAYEMAARTGRGHLSYEEATRYSLPPRALIGLLAPDFYGRGPAGFWGPWDRVEVGYAGVGTLLLTGIAGLTLISGSLRRRAGATADEGPSPASASALGFFALLVPVAFVLAMGRYTPLYSLIYRYVPTFDQIRAPARLIVLGNLGLAALAAYGLHTLGTQESRRKHPPAGGDYARWMAIAAGVGAVIFVTLGLPQARSLPPPDRVPQATMSIWVAGTLLALNGLLLVLARRSAWALWLVPLLLALDLILLGSTTEIEHHDPTRGFDHPQVVSHLMEELDPFRIESTAAAWQPDGALMHGLYDIGGVYNPLSLAPYEAYLWARGSREGLRYNLLGVKYVLADPGDRPEGEQLVPVPLPASAIDVYLNPAALPRALVVTFHRVVPDHEAAWQAIHDPAFDPARTVILERDQVLDDASSLPPGEAANGAGEVTFARYDANHIELRVDAEADGWVVLSDVYYPGWRATVDGEEAPVLRANYTFRAVRVPAGEHTLKMTFAPWTWRAGLAVSLITWLALAAAAIVALRARASTDLTKPQDSNHPCRSPLPGPDAA